jgi:hypothetical protein
MRLKSRIGISYSLCGLTLVLARADIGTVTLPRQPGRALPGLFLRDNQITDELLMERGAEAVSGGNHRSGIWRGLTAAQCGKYT